jgi:hypothetical protein
MALKIKGGLGVLLLLGIAGCASIGSGTVPRDRVDYITAVADSWKEQALLNIVRLRYGDAPTFIEVSSMISSYTLQGQVTAAGQISTDRTSTIHFQARDCGRQCDICGSTHYHLYAARG